MPTHTSASHILLYSDAFFIRVVLRRHFFCLFDLLGLIEETELTAAIVKWSLAFEWLGVGIRLDKTEMGTVLINIDISMIKCMKNCIAENIR